MNRVVSGDSGGDGSGAAPSRASGDIDEAAAVDLIDSCDCLARAIIERVAMPWNDAIGAAGEALERGRQEADRVIAAAREEEMRSRASLESARLAHHAQDIPMLTEAQARLSGLALPPADQALESARTRSESGASGFSWEGDPIEQLQQRVNSLYSITQSMPAIAQGELDLFWAWLKRWWWTGLGLWILLATTLDVRWDAGLMVSVSAVVAVGIAVVRNRVSAAMSHWQSLVDAVARKQAFIETAHVPAQIRAMQARVTQAVEAAEKSLESQRRALVMRCTRVAEQAMVEAERLGARIARIPESGGCMTAPGDDAESWRGWSPARHFAGVVRLGMLGARLAVPPGELGADLGQSKLMSGLQVPVLASLRGGRSIYVAIRDHARIDAAHRIAESLVFRILASAPPAKVRFTFIDPIGQGQNAAAFIALGDFDESLVGAKVWTNPRQIEDRLSELTGHMETVIQKYLRTDYATIDDYNAAAGEIAEAYRVVVVFDFPDSITESASRQLERITQNGARCGVYALVLHDTSRKAAHGVNEAALQQHSLVIRIEDGWCFSDDLASRILGAEVEGATRPPAFDAAWLSMDGAPPVELVRRVIGRIGEEAREALRVEVPYRKLLQLSGVDEDHLWQGNVIEGLRIPLGPGSARKPRYLELGVDLSVNALVIGRPGSGKSNLMHVAITTAALLYSPEDLQLYLIDFKEGVEFKPYAESRLPHARVVAIRSEREFGLSVLRDLDKRLKERGELFRKAGAENIMQYHDAIRGREGFPRIPRVLLVIDEFQEFFVKSDALADEVGVLLDRLVRQGRAFGMHMLLGSQTLAGFSLPKATLGLITVRIALQCSETDSRLVLADDNPAARLLSRPGEGIYNASSGLPEGNSLFQVALFDDDDRGWSLARIGDELSRRRARGEFPESDYPGPVVFEGHESAVLEQCVPLAALLAAESWPGRSRSFDVWLGEPVSLDPPTSMTIAPCSGSHLLVVSKNEDEAVGVILGALLSLVAQTAPGSGDVTILDLTTADLGWADTPEHIEELFPRHQVKVIDRRALAATMERLSAIVAERSEESRRTATTHYLVILGMHRARDLRQQDYASRLSLTSGPPDLASQLAVLLRDGPECGVHVFAWCDSYANLERTLDMRLLREFGTRVLGRMSESDSSRLIDDDAAGHIDRPHRLVKYDEERVGVIEVFRPYTIPGRGWIESIAAQLARRV